MVDNVSVLVLGPNFRQPNGMYSEFEIIPGKVETCPRGRASFREVRLKKVLLSSTRVSEGMRELIEKLHAGGISRNIGVSGLGHVSRKVCRGCVTLTGPNPGALVQASE